MQPICYLASYASLVTHTFVVPILHTAIVVANYLVILKYVFDPTTLASIVRLIWFGVSYTGERQAASSGR